LRPRGRLKTRPPGRHEESLSATTPGPRPGACRPTASSSARLEEFYRIAFRKKIYATIDDLQVDLDLWMRGFNEVRPHQGKWRFGKTPLQTFLDPLPLARETNNSANVNGHRRRGGNRH
jgi:hypothetical protein